MSPLAVTSIEFTPQLPQGLFDPVASHCWNVPAAFELIVCLFFEKKEPTIDDTVITTNTPMANIEAISPFLNRSLLNIGA